MRPVHFTPFAAPLGPDEVHLRLLNVTDLHMQIRAYDYFADQPTDGGGLARVASLIEALRNDVANSFTFDNGDFLQGNPMGDLVAETWDAGTLHPMITALNTLKLDAGTVGNHEFNYGLRFLRSVLDGAAYPVVLANAATRLGQTPSEDETFLPPFAWLDTEVVDGAGETHILKIAVLGFVPPQIVHWDRKHLCGALETRDIVPTAADYVRRLRSDGADLIVALCHSGIEDVPDRPGIENASLPLAALDGVDVVLTGHSHLVFPSESFQDIPDVDATVGHICGKPATMAGFGGSNVGVIDLRLCKSVKGWQVSESSVAVPAAADHAGQPGQIEAQILAATETAHQKTLAYIRRPVGRTAVDLNSYFSMLRPSASELFVAAAQSWYMRQALAATQHARLPCLSAASPFKMGGRGGPKNYTDVAAGDVAIRNVADLYGFPNMLRAIRLDGDALRDWLEHSAGIFRQVVPGTADNPLLDPSFPSYNFDTITGLTYQIDLAQPARFSKSGVLLQRDAARIVDLRHNGVPVTGDMEFIVATNDYRASGSGTYPGADDGHVVLSAPDAHRDVLIRFLQETSANRDLGPSPWRLAPMSHTSVLFETGALAMERWHDVASDDVEVLGVNARGFLDCRKAL